LERRRCATAVVEFVERTESEAVPVDEGVAVFDNDGTLWCEKPMPIQLDFILRRLAAMAEAKSELRERQPWKAAYERDYAWLATVLAEHYAGDETNVRMLLAGVLAAHEEMSVDDFEAQSDSFLRTVQHPTLGRGYLECAYLPKLELLAYLEANGFSNYIASGGGRDFMRPISQEIYGIPRDRVIGSATALEYRGDDDGGTIMRKAEPDYLDDGPQKPIRIWGRVGRRPLLAAGKSNGDIPMLDSPSTGKSGRFVCWFSTTTPSASSTTRAVPSRALAKADASGWTVVSIKNDWAAVF
jgi:phosphoserine phosphatase